MLQELLAGSSSDALKQIARLRLAKILLYQDKAQQVVDLLEGQEGTAFAAAYSEVLGDAYVALGRIADAQAAYQQVLMDPQAQGTVDQRLVQWKALDLPEIAADEPAPEPIIEPTMEPIMEPTEELTTEQPTDAAATAAEEATE